MDMVIAEGLYNMLKDSGVEVSLHDNYSGRGMYGSTTAGVSGDFDSGYLVALILQTYFDDALDHYFDDESLMGSIDNLHFNWDSMGLGSIIY